MRYDFDMGSKPLAAAAVRFDAGSEAPYAPELYRPGGVAFGVERLEDIGPPEVKFYRENGYLTVRQAFTLEETGAARDGLVDLIMGSHPEFEDIRFEARAKPILSALSPEQRQDAVRGLMNFGKYDSRLSALTHHVRLRAVLRLLLGGREPQLFQEMALIKPPRIGREKPWHQDKAYFDLPLGTPVVGAWIALDEATIENGCMQVLPGRHQNGPIPHFQRRDWQICDSDVLGLASVAAPLEPGGLLLFDGMLPHGTPHNTSPRRRRALQFHYAPAGVARNAREERLRNFGGEGRNVSC